MTTDRSREPYGTDDSEVLRGDPEWDAARDAFAAWLKTAEEQPS